MAREKRESLGSAWTQWGKAAAIPGVQYALEKMQEILEDLQRSVYGEAALQGNLPSLPAMPVAEVEAEAEAPSKLSKIRTGYWAQMTPEERSEEMKRRGMLGRSPGSGRKGKGSRPLDSRTRREDLPPMVDGWYTAKGVVEVLEGAIKLSSVVHLWASRGYRKRAMTSSPNSPLVYHPQDVAKEAKRRGIPFQPPAAAPVKKAQASGRRQIKKPGVGSGNNPPRKVPQPPVIDGWYTKLGAAGAIGASKSRIDYWIGEKKLRTKSYKYPGIAQALTLVNPEDLQKVAEASGRQFHPRGEEVIQ